MKAAATRLEDFYVVEKIALEVKRVEDVEEKENTGAEAVEELGSTEEEGKAEENAQTKKGKKKGKPSQGRGRKKGSGKEGNKGKGSTKGKTGKDKGKAKVTVKEEKDVVFVRDVPEFIEFIAKERKLDPSKVTVRVGLDGGQETFKVVVSVFDASEEGPKDEEDENGDAKLIGSGLATEKKSPSNQTQNTG